MKRNTKIDLKNVRSRVFIPKKVSGIPETIVNIVGLSRWNMIMGILNLCSFIYVPYTEEQKKTLSDRVCDANGCKNHAIRCERDSDRVLFYCPEHIDEARCLYGIYKKVDVYFFSHEGNNDSLAENSKSMLRYFKKGCEATVYLRKLFSALYTKEGRSDEGHSFWEDRIERRAAEYGSMIDDGKINRDRYICEMKERVEQKMYDKMCRLKCRVEKKNEKIERLKDKFLTKEQIEKREMEAQMKANMIQDEIMMKNQIRREFATRANRKRLGKPIEPDAIFWDKIALIMKKGSGNKLWELDNLIRKEWWKEEVIVNWIDPTLFNDSSNFWSSD